MRAINHALTGAIIGLTIQQPAVALPLAFASHFVLDVVPHYDDPKRFPIQSKAFVNFLLVDALLCGLVVAALVVARPDGWLVPSICAFLATSPDFMWIPKFLNGRREGTPGPERHSNPILQFHHVIQWFTRPSGLIIELVWLIAAAYLLARTIA